MQTKRTRGMGVCWRCQAGKFRASTWSAAALLAALSWSSHGHAQGQVVRPRPPAQPTPEPTPPKPQRPASTPQPIDGGPRKSPTSPSGTRHLDPDGPPAVVEPRPSRSKTSVPTSERSSRPSEPRNTLRLPFRYSLEIGGHLTIADDNLASITQRWGGGADATALVGPRHWPLLFGLQTGFDSFGGPSRTFRYQRELSNYRLERTGFWLHGVVRLEPEWTIRPHFDVMAGLWALNVGVGLGTGTNRSQDSIGTAVTGSYGVGAGVRFVSPHGFSGGLSLVYLRGGAMTVPHVESSFVENEVLYFDDRRVPTVSQVMIMLQFGWVGS